MKINQLYEAKPLDEIHLCPQERLIFISNTTGLSFALERIGPLATIIITVFYLLILYLSTLSNNPKNPFASIYSDSLIKTACQHLLLLVGFDTLIYRKYYDTPPILVGHHTPAVAFVFYPQVGLRTALHRSEAATDRPIAPRVGRLVERANRLVLGPPGP
jgi:hypothetical protein